MSDKRQPPPKTDEIGDDAFEIEVDETAASPVSRDDSEELKKLQGDLEKAKSDYLYLGAEFDNYKKQAIRERGDLVKFGAERFIRDLLEVIDNFERALKMEMAPENQAKLREGVELIYRELQSLLSRFGVQEINPAGQPFDPATQEALSSEPTDALPPGSVTRVFRKAYRMYDRLIRPAQVVVATAPAPKSESNKTE